ncbi:hypothetical protein KIK06_22825 [Nocardiopsis sp. EMB25]|uniref:hypothetical protein n=1 Tax=Nocardiopsis sp. EMB25 TaxID=2835867 RepID=UPI002284D771|nr:hypothetical protein [Nocardiopsis sp. EMB25]MCY9786723.1 hypothetical protein [Nocardiopsis sp. EMB25]
MDPSPFTLIDPEAIPYPLTDTWSLNFAAEKLRTGGENLAAEAEDMRSTWQGLQAHYEAPESEELFAKMNPMVTRGEDIESDLVTVAGALEDLAEAATTARRSLNNLRMQAQSFVNRHSDRKWWWLDNDEETDSLAIQENIRLKSEVNTAWETFNEAEIACANTIAELSGGTRYAAPGTAHGPDVVEYGLPPGVGERSVPGLDLDSYANTANDLTAWAGTEFHPSLMTFEDSTGQAAWDVFVVDGLWGTGVGLATTVGVWSPDRGWTLLPWDQVRNAGVNLGDAGMNTAAMVGIHDEEGWLFDWDRRDEAYWGASWDRWTGNVQNTGVEFREGFSAWSRREEDPEYHEATTAFNTVMLTGGIPLKIIKTVSGLGTAATIDVDVPTDRDGSFSDRGRNDPSTSGGHSWGASVRERSDAGAGGGSTSERFDSEMDGVRDSLLDPERFRPNPGPRPETPSPNPNGPAPTGGNEPSPPRNPVNPRSDEGAQSQGGGRPPNRSDDEDTDQRSDGEDRPETRPDTDQRRDDPGARDDDTSSPQDTDQPERRGDREAGDGPREESESPEPATDGGSDGGDDQPPRDRTGSGGDDDGRDDDDRAPSPDEDETLSPGGALSQEPRSITETGGTDTGEKPGSPDGPDPNTVEPAMVKDKWGDLVEFGSTDASGRWFDEDGVAYIEIPDSVEHAKAYERIREAAGDVEAISELTGVDQGVVNRIKEHIFLRDHDVAVGANEVSRGRFTPMGHIANWWEQATQGKVPDSEKEFFRRWIEHEAIESKLMEWGMPYNSSHPSNWQWDDVYEEVVYRPNSEHYGAHDVSRSEGKADPFGHYRGRWNEPDIALNESLTNAEEVALVILEGYRK